MEAIIDFCVPELHLCLCVSGWIDASRLRRRGEDVLPGHQYHL